MTKRKTKAAAADETTDNAATETEAVTSENNEELSAEFDAAAPVTADTAPIEQPSLTEGETDSDEDNLPDNDRAAPGSNSDAIVKGRQAVMRDVGQLGSHVGLGSKALVALAETVCTGAVNGYLTEDHAKPIYEKFRKSAAAKAGKIAPDEQGAASQRVQESKLRSFIKLGLLNDHLVENPAGDISDSVSLLLLARDMHAEAYNDDKRKPLLKTKNSYEAMLNVARAQLKEERRGVWMTEDDVAAEMFNADTERAPKTGLDFIKAAIDAMEKAKKGKDAKDNDEGGFVPGRAPVEHESVQHAIDHCWVVLRDLDPAYVAKVQREAAEAEAKAAKRAADKAAKQAEAAQKQAA